MATPPRDLETMQGCCLVGGAVSPPAGAVEDRDSGDADASAHWSDPPVVDVDDALRR